MAAMLLGAQFLSVGFLGELLTAYHSRDTKTYALRERAGDPALGDHAAPLDADPLDLQGPRDARRPPDEAAVPQSASVDSSGG